MKTTLKDKVISLFVPFLLKKQWGRDWLVRRGGIPLCYVQKHWREMNWALVAGCDLLCAAAVDALDNIWVYDEDGYHCQEPANRYWDAYCIMHPDEGRAEPDNVDESVLPSQYGFDEE